MDCVLLELVVNLVPAFYINVNCSVLDKRTELLLCEGESCMDLKSAKLHFVIINAFLRSFETTINVYQ